MTQHSFESAIALKTWHAQHVRLKTAQYFLPLSRILNIWNECVSFIEKFLLYLTEISFMLQWLDHGNAQPMCRILNNEVRVRKILLRSEKHPAALGATAIKSKNAYPL